MNKHSRNVTLKDIAQVLGLSANAISMGLNGTGQLAPQTRALIRETAKKMNYRPNSAARSLVLKKSMLIGAVLPYVNQSFFCKIVAGIESVAQEHGFALLLCNADGGREGDERVYIAVTDTGCGIPPEKYDQAFERFTKLDPFSQGNGLGLYLCRLIVRHLGGEIRIDPEYTEGTRIVVVLPRK